MSFLGVFKTALTKMVCKKITPFSGCACSIGEGGGVWKGRKLQKTDMTDEVQCVMSCLI